MENWGFLSGTVAAYGDDEIGLMNDVTVGGRIGAVGDGNGGDKRDHNILVQSSFVQSMNKP